jgi:hypothetical protein
MAGRDVAVDPVRAIDARANRRNLVGSEDAWNAQQHDEDSAS